MATKLGQKLISSGLLLGDLTALYASLWMALLLRYLEVPSNALFVKHFLPFSFIFVVWIVVFYIADLYGRSFKLQNKSLPGLIFKSQAINGIIAIMFFYLLPYYGITPKTVLIVDVAVSFLFLYSWRMLARSFLRLSSAQSILAIGSGKEFQELVDDLKEHPQHGFSVLEKIDAQNISQNFSEDLKKTIDNSIKNDKNLAVVVESFADCSGGAVAYFYDLMSRGVRLIDFQKFYENIFQHVPLSFVNEAWLLENISSSKKDFYDLPKRIIDILTSLIFGILSLLFYPFIILLIKIGDRGPVFFINKRVGQGRKIFKHIKFRSMRVDADSRWPEKGDRRITKIGSFLRKTRMDELPQLWNVLKGDMSFVGPRPDFLDFAQKLEKEIPYYNIRNLIKPGLTGWAQIQQVAPSSVEETERRLAYDIYYIKNRSIILDLTIILKTIRIMLSRSGV
ncbi:MAG: sugar transferase [Parcubacteria group bacterium GW2011_GWA2_39_18]|nr:MAG: sugar transferase [Parcubacteria group bacterium GW2011_GWA2_39_18]